MRGDLSKKKLEEINNKLPIIDDRLWLATSQGPGVDINDLGKKGTLGVALVCLGDAVNRFSDTRVSLFEAFACLIWYREESPKAPLEIEAINFAKFYADYATLLLYAIGEDIADFVINYLGISKDLKQFLNDPKIQRIMENKKVSSNAAKVGIYMKENLSENDITKIILDLKNDQNWKKSLDYRNEWVHEKPPIIRGLSIEYNRQSRVKKSKKGELSISFGGGSKPKYAIEELLDIILSAIEAVAKALSSLLEIVIKRREEFEKLDYEKNRITAKLL